MKTHQSECGVHSPSSHGGEGRTLRARRAAETYLLALMPSLRVAKPSATSDSAMFSPLVSDKEKKETWILGLNPSPIAKGLYWDHFHPQLFKLVLPTNWTRQQAGVGFFRKPLLPQNVSSLGPRDTSSLGLFFSVSPKLKAISGTPGDWRESKAQVAARERINNTDLRRRGWCPIQTLPLHSSLCTSVTYSPIKWKNACLDGFLREFNVCKSPCAVPSTQQEWKQNPKVAPTPAQSDGRHT